VRNHHTTLELVHDRRWDDSRSHQVAQHRAEQEALHAHLVDIVENARLSALLQPIIDMSDGTILGYEGLIRGPSDSVLHSPLNLFKLARSYGMQVEVEHLCRRVVIQHFADLDLPGKLFLNVSPDCLLLRDARHGKTVELIHAMRIDPGRVIIELTENQPTYDYALMREAVMHYRRMGFRIAIDDLGEGFSSLRLWSELRPDYVKIDMHFIQGINHDPVKLQFVRSIQEIAGQSETRVIAEGIENQAELLMLRDLGVAYGQGYHIGRPSPRPSTEVPKEVRRALKASTISIYPQNKVADRHMDIASLVRAVPAYSPSLTNNALYEVFMADPSLQVAPIVADGKPLGLVARTVMLDHFARQYQRELYGKRSCTAFMDAGCLIAELSTPLQELGYRMANGEAHHLANGFIVTDGGVYLGIGTGHDLMREMTQLQITAARYANPLTQLPGNVPIDEHIDRLLRSGARFHACYCDLDHFKPYNDVYGYRKGDDLIQLVGNILTSQCDPDRDFVGHIGGDDFMLLMQSEDWELRCGRILAQFASAVPACYSADDLARGAIVAEDRQGNASAFPLTTLSLGVISVEGARYASHHAIAAASSAAKAQAKKIKGNSLFLDRRLG
jgi:diguanylate cyclase (GGDEF)-like protein